MDGDGTLDARAHPEAMPPACEALRPKSGRSVTVAARTYVIEIDPGSVPSEDVVGDARNALEAVDVAFRFESPDDYLAHGAAVRTAVTS